MNTNNNTNKIELTCRAAENPIILKEKSGNPVFTSIFCLDTRHSAFGENTLPITIKGKGELAPFIINRLKCGCQFTATGRLEYWKNPNTNRESYSILAEDIQNITEPPTETIENEPEYEH